MKITKRKDIKDGVELTVRLAPGEKLVAVTPNCHYKLGYPVEDVVIGDVVADAVPVTWCSVRQEWVQ